MLCVRCQKFDIECTFPQKKGKKGKTVNASHKDQTLKKVEQQKDAKVKVKVNVKQITKDINTTKSKTITDNNKP